MLRYPDNWYVQRMTAEEFILGMLELGTPVEMSVVGVFDPTGTKGRGSRRDQELPMHRDGVYSAALAASQGGHYVEAKDVDVVGLYCVREGAEPCYTAIGDEEDNEIAAVSLRTGEALIFDNNTVRHGRRGPVGDRILIRFWIKRFPTTEPGSESNQATMMF